MTGSASADSSLGAFPEATKVLMDVCSLVTYGLHQCPASQDSGLQVRIRGIVDVERAWAGEYALVIRVIVENLARPQDLALGWNTRVSLDTVLDTEDKDLFTRLLSSVIVAEVRAHWIAPVKQSIRKNEWERQRYREIRHDWFWGGPLKEETYDV